MGTEQSASMMRIAVLAVIVAVAMSSMEQEVEVSELADAGHTAKAQLGEAKVTPAQLNTIAANNNNPDMAGTGRFKGTKTLNFPGTPYGKPGYKESHNWESDVDYFMPAVFNTKFSLNQYVQNNPTAAEGDKTCKEVLDHYLRSGIFDGFDGSVGFPISTKGNKHSFALKKKQQVAENVVVKPARQYTYTFWLSVSDVMAPQTNVMQFGVKDYPRTPALFMKPASTNLVFKVSQTNDPDFGCETTDKAPGVLATGKWHMIALAVKESAIELYVDGVKKCEKKNSEGGTLTPVPNSQLYISNPWLPPARGQ